MAAPKPTHLSICAHTKGFRRAGRAWDTSAEIVAIAELSKAQLAALQAEPEIVLSTVEPPKDNDAAQ